VRKHVSLTISRKLQRKRKDTNTQGQTNSTTGAGDLTVGENEVGTSEYIPERVYPPHPSTYVQPESMLKFHAKSTEKMLKFHAKSTGEMLNSRILQHAGRAGRSPELGRPILTFPETAGHGADETWQGPSPECPISGPIRRGRP
jgi:hypothetical protein